MKNIRDHFDTSLIFWKEFPEFTLINPFNELYENDKDKKKIESSKIAWAIHLAYNPNSKFYNIPDKLQLIAKDFLKNIKFKWDNQQMQLLISTYKLTALNQYEISLDNWNEIMQLRDKNLKDAYKQIFNDDTDILDSDVLKNIKLLDDRLALNAKLFQDFLKIKESINLSNSEKKDNKIKSYSDNNDF